MNNCSNNINSISCFQNYLGVDWRNENNRQSKHLCFNFDSLKIFSVQQKQKQVQKQVQKQKILEAYSKEICEINREDVVINIDFENLKKMLLDTRKEAKSVAKSKTNAMALRCNFALTFIGAMITGACLLCTILPVFVPEAAYLQKAGIVGAILFGGTALMSGLEGLKARFKELKA